MESFNVFVILLLVSQHAVCVEVPEGAESVLLPCSNGVRQADGVVSQHAVCVEVSEGAESVVLPCSHPVSEADGVVWTRSSSRVHARGQSGDDLSGQDPRYVSRTSMREDAPGGGDLSLTLTTPNVNDSGNYNCTARFEGLNLSYTVVQLVVTAPVEAESSSDLVKILVPVGVIAALAIIAIAIAGFVYWYKRRKGRQETHNQLNLAPLSPSVLKVEVESGAESVLLPFRTTADLSGDVKVEWMDSSDGKVHVYPNMSEQHEDYSGRTQMSEDALRTGDLSLTLRLPAVTDSKVYSCTIRRDGDELDRQQVELQVKDLKVEVESGAKSVLLPFRTTADLPKKSFLRWLIEDPDHEEPKKVHVFDTDHDEPGEQHEDYRCRTQMRDDPLGTGDLSLTLRRPTVRDSNTYTCIVMGPQFKIEKTVQLEVKDRILVEDEAINNRRSSSTDPTPLMADQSNQ